MDEYNEEEIKAKIVYSLYRKKYFGERHTPPIFICKRLSNIPCKYINKQLKKLAKEGIIGIYTTGHGKDIYLNPKKIKEIENTISHLIEDLYNF
ncbi:hypothetical protein LJC03_02340 [Methanobrevibacter sp. OttesenSCG-928-I08]|nr:hypothetical protein [Methanobrevibacter sp. OttesenSCG-928-I08]